MSTETLTTTTGFQITPGRRTAARRLLACAPGLEADVRRIAAQRQQTLPELLNDWTARQPTVPHIGYGNAGGSALDRRLVLELLVSTGQ